MMKRSSDAIMMVHRWKAAQRERQCSGVVSAFVRRLGLTLVLLVGLTACWHEANAGEADACLLWQRTFEHATEIRALFCARDERLVVSVSANPATPAYWKYSRVFMLTRSGNVLWSFRAPGASKTRLVDVSASADRVLCEGLLPVERETEGLHSRGILLDGEHGTILAVVEGHRDGEAVADISDDGKMILMSGGGFISGGYPGSRCVLFDDAGKTLWTSDTLDPPLRAGGNVGRILSGAGNLVLLLHGDNSDQYKYITCVDRSGRRLWDCSRMGLSGLGTSADGRFVILYGQTHFPGMTLSDLPADSWPFTAPSGMKDAWIWKGGWTSMAHSSGAACGYAVAILRVHAKKPRRGYVDWLWGRAESRWGRVRSSHSGTTRSYRLLDAVIGSGSTGVTVVLRFSDRKEILTSDDKAGELTRLSWNARTRLDKSPAVGVSADGSHIVTTSKGPNGRILVSVNDRSGKLERSFRLPPKSAPIAFTPDARLMAVGQNENRLLVYDLSIPSASSGRGSTRRNR